MSEPFVAEIRIFPFNFPPKGWAFCDGQLMVISQNTALFSLLGTSYGGDGKTSFGLPNLKGSAPMHWGQGAGLSERVIGEASGTASVTLTTEEMALHTHGLLASPDPAELKAPTPARCLARSSGGFAYELPPANLKPMAASAVGLAGGSQGHNNLMPFLTFNFNIALQGVYPSRG
jgi:microcystin-dependent protein